MPLRVIIADDHHIVREGIRALLERAGFEVVGDAADGAGAVVLARTLKPDVAVLDLMMPGLNGLDAGRQILQYRSGTAVVLLTMHTDEYQVAAALRAGIRGFLVKTQAAEDLARAIRRVVRGQTFVTAAVSHLADASREAATQEASLAPRERQVVQLIAEGHTSREIASQLGLSVKTVDSYRARVLEKLGLHDTAGLVRYAIRHGIIEP